MCSDYRQALIDKAQIDRRRCRQWLLPFIQSNQPKLFTKAELQAKAIADLNVSKNCFNGTWIRVIEETGRHDWYEPLRKRRIQKN